MTGFTGPQGFKGDIGPRGEAFEVDAFNVTISENGSELSTIQGGSGSAIDFYVFVVATDNRSDKNTFGMNFDLSRHVVAWNGSTFTSYGEFTGIRGETGANGDKGEQGIKGEKGMTGTVGPTGAAGTDGLSLIHI